MKTHEMIDPEVFDPRGDQLVKKYSRGPRPKADYLVYDSSSRTGEIIAVSDKSIHFPNQTLGFIKIAETVTSETGGKYIHDHNGQRIGIVYNLRGQSVHVTVRATPK